MRKKTGNTHNYLAMNNKNAKNTGDKQPDVEFRLRERERFLRTLITNLPGAVFRSRADAEFTREFISDGCFELTGYQAAEIVGENAVTDWKKLIHRADRERVADELRRHRDDTETLDGEQFLISYRLVARDGSVKNIRERFRFIHDANGKINALEGFVTDITKSVRAEELLRESETRYQTLFNTIDEGFGIIEVLFDDAGQPFDHRILEANPAFEKNSGVANPAGKTASELAPGIEQYWNKLYASVVSSGKSAQLEQYSDALNRWFDVYISRIGDEKNGKVAVLFSDITVKKRGAMNLAFLAEISQTLINIRNVDEMMTIVGAKIGAFLNLSNCAFAEINRAKDEAVITHNWHQPDAPDLIGVYRISELVNGEFLNAVRAGKIFAVGDTQIDSRTNSAQYAALQIGSFAAVPLVQKSEWKFMIAVYHFETHEWQAEEIELLGELTTRIWTRLERARAENELRESESRYKLLAENMHDLVCLHDLDAKFIYVSPSSEILLGYVPAELVGVSIYELIHPQDVELIRDAAHRRLLNGEISSIVVEYRMHDKKGEYCWFETLAQTVAAPNGEIIQLQTVSRDVSKRKEDEAEREKNQKELAQLFLSEQESRREADVALVKAEHASRAKDEFLQMVSHEFRTPLTTIKTLTRILQHDGKTEAERQKYLETIAAECDRQIDLILNLLDVSRFDEGDVDLKHESVDISRVLKSCDKIERPAADARRQTLTVEREDDLPPISGDEKAIRRALCTIIENAVKYTPEGGAISVKTERVVTHQIKSVEERTEREIAIEEFGDLPKQMNFPVEENSSKEEIIVSICDNGRGILPADIPKIFQKFYRGAKPNADASTDGTPDDAAGKAETPGVGLGLYLAKRLITALGGRITVDSEVGRGSCFSIFLPIWNENSHEKDTLDEYNFDEK